MNEKYKNNKYSTLFKWIKTLPASVLLSAALVPHASAHLMVAQHGSLNFKDNGVFMVLSLPVSAFENTDDDGDGKMSSVEFSKHRPKIITEVKNNISLSDAEGLKPLQGLLLSPVIGHDDAKAPFEQLIIMGRFALSSSLPLSTSKGKVITANDKSNNTKNDLVFHADLFGKTLAEKSLDITATRSLSTDEKPQKHEFILTPDSFENQLFKPNTVKIN